MKIPGAELKTAAWLVGVPSQYHFVGLTVALSTVTGWASGAFFF